MNKRLNTNRGSALLIALLLTAMLSLIAIMAVDTSNTDIELAYNQSNLESAFYNAEAGAKRAFVALNDDDDWRTGYNNTGFGQGAFSVQMFDSVGTPALFDTVVIRSQGNVQDAQAEVELWTVPVYYYPFTYAMWADAWINFDQAGCTDSYNSDSGTYASTLLPDEGDIGTNGTITTAKLVTIGGDAFTATAGGITLGAGAKVLGDTSTTKDSVVLPEIPQSEYDWARAHSVASSGMSGTFTYNNSTKALTLGKNATVTLTSGVYYFSTITLGQYSNIALAPGAKVTIYMSGNITFGQYSKVNTGGQPANLQFFSQGTSLAFNQGCEFYASFYGPDAHIQYDQTTQVYGALVANTIKLDQGACFHYDRSLGKVVHGTTGEMIQVAWKEL